MKRIFLVLTVIIALGAISNAQVINIPASKIAADCKYILAADSSIWDMTGWQVDTLCTDSINIPVNYDTKNARITKVFYKGNNPAITVISRNKLTGIKCSFDVFWHNNEVVRIFQNTYNKKRIVNESVTQNH